MRGATATAGAAAGAIPLAVTAHVLLAGERQHVGRRQERFRAGARAGRRLRLGVHQGAGGVGRLQQQRRTQCGDHRRRQSQKRVLVLGGVQQGDRGATLPARVALLHRPQGLLRRTRRHAHLDAAGAQHFAGRAGARGQVRAPPLAVAHPAQEDQGARPLRVQGQCYQQDGRFTGIFSTLGFFSRSRPFIVPTMTRYCFVKVYTR